MKDLLEQENFSKALFETKLLREERNYYNSVPLTSWLADMKDNAPGIKWFNIATSIRNDAKPLTETGLCENNINNVTGNEQNSYIAINNVNSFSMRGLKQDKTLNADMGFQLQGTKLSGQVERLAGLQSGEIYTMAKTIGDQHTPNFAPETGVMLLEQNEGSQIYCKNGSAIFYNEKYPNLSSENLPVKQERTELPVEQRLAEIPAHQDKGCSSNDFSVKHSPLSSSSSEHFWEMDSSSFDELDFSDFVEEIDGYVEGSHGKLCETRPTTIDQFVNNGSNNSNSMIYNMLDSPKAASISPSSIGAQESVPDVTKSDNSDTGCAESCVAQINLNTCSIALLVQALQTQSFTPIVTLLSSLLNKQDAICSNFDTFHDRNDIRFANSTLRDNRALISQNSFDSDLSDSTVYSPYSADVNNNDDDFFGKKKMHLDTEQSECVNIHTIDSQEKFHVAQEKHLPTPVAKKANRPPKRPATDQTVISRNKIQRIDENVETVNFHSTSTNIDGIIANAMKQGEQCDVQTFINILNQSQHLENKLYSIGLNGTAHKCTNTERIDMKREESCFPQKLNRQDIVKVKEKTSKWIDTYQDCLALQKGSTEYVDQKEIGQTKQRKGRKKGMKHATLRPGPNKCYHLWDFLRDMLDSKDKSDADVIHWVDEEYGEFQLKDTKRLAELWGMKKRLTNMNYDKLSRSLRYYIKLDILQKIPGKRLHFRFGNGRMWRKIS